MGQKVLGYTEFLDSNDHETTTQWAYWFPEGQLESRLNSYLEYTEFLTLHDILNSSLRVYRFPAYHFIDYLLMTNSSDLVSKHGSLILHCKCFDHRNYGNSPCTKSHQIIGINYWNFGKYPYLFGFKYTDSVFVIFWKLWSLAHKKC